MLRRLKAMIETSEKKDIITAYQVGCGLCALLVLGVTTYDIHRSIKVNDTPPSKEQLESLAATINNSTRAGQISPIDNLLGRNGRNPRENLAFMQKIAPMEEDDRGVHIVGLVSDTHGVLDEATVLALCQATNTIIHAGDVGDKRYKRRLSAEQLIAKLAEKTGKDVMAVSGNVDEGCTQLPPWLSLKIAGKKIIVIHICGFPPENTGESEDLIKSEAPDIVVFGHSHVPRVQEHDRIIYINPGSAGPRRFKLPRCIALLTIHKFGEVSVEFVSVGNLPQDVSALPTMYRNPVCALQEQDFKPICVPEGPGEEKAIVANSVLNVQYRKRRKCE